MCLTDGETALTYAEVAASSHRIAAALADAGVTPGDVVATVSPNHVRYLEAVLGIVRAGAVWLPVNARYGADEMAHALRSNDACFVFTHSAHLDAVRTACGTLPDMRGIVCIDTAVPGAPGLADWSRGYPHTGIDVPQGPDTVVAIRSTGGTTGPSKGVMISNRNYETLFACLFSTLPFPAGPVHLAAAPLSHAAGTMALATMIHGGRTRVMPRFTPGDVLRLIEEERVTHIFLTPTMIYMLLNDPEIGAHDCSSLHTVIYSGAPMSVDKLTQAIARFGPVFAQAFGQAEAPFFCTILPQSEHVPLDDPAVARRLKSCGQSTPFVRVEIMDPEGRLLPPGERGEIVVKGDLVMKGYYNNPEATEKAGRFGWHHTGDIGYKDEDGYLYLVDRERDVIISGGFNIFPTEIEQVIWSHPGVQDCAVIGVPDDIWGEAVKAVVQPRPGATLSEAEITALCRERLGGMKTPKSVEFWPDLPRSPVGKVLKRDIRSRFWKDRDRAV
ncbi:AMP-binding protein [Hyphomicrobiales bacterium FT118]|uniref:AMP-binding protein n=1 Tax=Futiania mangrovi TaxID=2959716 RepID=A0A9J6PJN6_9PROT|nr:AMP-binding protein [Futiania mangrovii]